jgi:8-oxo-dGTP pyrophosphatase MutT (NUDIX family)
MRELPEEIALPAGMLPDEPPSTPAEPRDSATVALLRDTPEGTEVFLLRRVAAMAFAAGMTVFPGGGVDRRDADATVAWAGPGADWWARAFDCPPELARALVCAAVRETFEESGVLLAGPDATSVVADTTPFADARRALVERETSFAEFLAANSLVLRADLLRPWSNWITPAEEPRRYDTRFFVAALPVGQIADGVTTEASDGAWQRPADALADGREGRRALMPPTLVTLADLAEHPSVASVMDVDRDVQKILPKLVRDGDRVRVVLPKTVGTGTVATGTERAR